MPLDHHSLLVPSSAIAPLTDFLTTSLSHMGFKPHVRFGPTVVGLGETVAYFWLAGTDEVDEDTMKKLCRGNHVAFTATGMRIDKEQVDAFHAAALKAGGIDNGKPGPRPQYHKGYYAAFVRDPVVGVNWEVVCHSGAGGKERVEGMVKKAEEAG
ncbi:MAG: hypothetical protein Q9220_000783 [cf. Caloplaca sp. 1 TL-2023]